MTEQQRFVKKPVEISATQWFRNGDHPLDHHPMDTKNPTGEDRKRYDDYLLTEGKVVRYYRHPEVSGKATCQKCGNVMHAHGWIDTLEGGHIVCPGDWIITGVQGEHYPCKPDIFEATYQPAGDQHPDDAAVDRFATAMKAKLAKKRADGRGGWQTASEAHLSALLHEHVAKGDPVDVANLAMMLHQIGQRVAALSHAEGEAVDLEIGAGDVLICDLGTASAAGVAFYRDNAAHDVGTHHPELSGMGGTELAGRIFSVMTEKPESLVVLYNAVGRALATLGHPAPHAEGEAFGWFTEDHDTDKSATTYDPVVADRWRKKGWPVWPLYTHPAPQVAGLTETAIKSSPAYRALHREKDHLLGLLKEQAPQVAVPAGYTLVPEDMLTHFRDFHDAVKTLSKTADPDGYWEHQCKVCKRIESQLAAARLRAGKEGEPS